MNKTNTPTKEIRGILNSGIPKIIVSSPSQITKPKFETIEESSESDELENLEDSVDQGRTRVTSQDKD